MTSKIEELSKKVEDRFKLNALETGKRFADLELKLGKLEERLNGVWTDFPKLKEKTSEIEDLLNIINLGLIDYKGMFEKIDSRISTLEKLPEDIKKTLLNHENRLKDLDEHVMKLSASLSTLETLKGDITKSLEETISSNVRVLKEEDERNRLEIDHIKSDLNAISSAIKSLDRTIELTNLDDIIRRFDSLDKKLLNTETEIGNLRSLMPSITKTEGDIEVLKERVKEMSSTIMDALGRMNEFEMEVNKKMLSIKNLAVKAEHLEFIESVAEKVRKDVANLGEIRTAVGELYNDVIKRVSGLERVDIELKELKTDIMDLRRVVDENRSKLRSFDEESMMRIITDNAENKNKIRELTERLEILKPEEMMRAPKDIMDEISSLKKIVNSLSVENERLKKMTSMSPEMSADLLSRIKTLEKKVEEIEKRLGEAWENRPVVLE